MQAVIKRKQEAEKKALERQRAVDWIKQIADGSADLRDEDINEHINYIELIKGYAVFADKYERIKEVKPLLNDTGISDEFAALEFIIKIGQWDESEDPIFKRFGIKENIPAKGYIRIR